MSSVGRIVDVEGQYVVVHKVVALRTSPSINGSIWGRLLQDTKVYGVPHRVGSETWVKLSEQKLTNSLQTIAAQDEVWALLDATHVQNLTGLGELLRRVSNVRRPDAGDAAAASEAIDQDTCDTWRVVPPRAVVRHQASTGSRSKILGYYERGTVVQGDVKVIGGHRWLRLRLKSGAYANMLIDGSCLGLGPLLEAAHGASPENTDPKEMQTPEAYASGGSAPSAEPKAKAKAKAKAQAVEDLGNLGPWLLHEPGPWASFVVVPEQAVMRSLPSVKSRPRGMLKKGDIIEGEIRSEWLLLDRNMQYPELSDGRGRWVLIDATPLKLHGVGRILERHIDKPTVKSSFSEALEVACPDKGDLGCCLEVKVNDKIVVSKPCEAKAKTMFVNGLTPSCQAFLRFCVREARKEGDSEEGKVVASSIWIDAKTREHPPAWEEGDPYMEDLLGQPRSCCSKCDCKAFAIDTEVVSVNMDMSSARCARCGCLVGAHPIWQPPVVEEKGRKGKKAAPSVPEAPLLIERAVALPKDTIFARWRPLDFAEGVKEWPHLSKSFQEVVAWSDLHSDMGANMDHLRSLPECPETVLLLAGDLATKMEVLESSLRLLKVKFGAVFYVPGNHELWVVKKEGLSSVHKFLAILELCERLEVHTRPAFISEDCAVCPLFSWYKDNLVDGFSRDKANIPFDIQTQWPWDITGRGDTNDAQQHEIADFFAGLNERRINMAPPQAVKALENAVRDAERLAQDGASVQLPQKGKDIDKAPSVITMSHFIPRQEVYPGPRRLCGVMGCREIEDQVRRAGAQCHIFGHSHIACDREVDAIRYVQHPLGYPNDYHRKHRPMRVWGKGSAPSKEVGEAKEPAATICKDIWQAFEKEIRDCKEKEMVRPPGRWSTQGSELWEMGKSTHDPKAEKALQAELGHDAKKIAELWSSRPPKKAIAVKVTSMLDATQSIDLEVMNDLTVKQLKDEIVKMVGRGPASKISLSVTGESTVPDHLELSSIEGLEGGLSLMGIDMSKGKEVYVKIIHKTSDTPQSLVVRVMDTSTILDVRKAVMEKLGEKSLSSCKIVRTLGSAFSSVPDKDPLNGRTELFFLGRPLPEATINVEVSVIVPKGAPMVPLKFRLDSGSTVLDLKKELIAASTKSGQGGCEPADLRITRPSKLRAGHGHGEGDEIRESEQLWASEKFDCTTIASSASATPSPAADSGSAAAKAKAAAAMAAADPSPGAAARLPTGVSGGGSGAPATNGSADDAQRRSEAKQGAEKNGGSGSSSGVLPLEFLVNGELKVSLGQVRAGQLTVADLRRRISEAARRGPASALKVELPGLGPLSDLTDVFTLRGAGGEVLTMDQPIELTASGLDTGPPKEVRLRIVHGSSDESQELNITVEDTSTVGEVRSAIMQVLNEKQRSSVRLVKRSKGTFVSLEDSELLNGRKELIMMGRPLPPPGSQDQVPAVPVGQQKEQASQGGGATPSAALSPNGTPAAQAAPAAAPPKAIGQPAAWTLARVLELLRALKQCCASKDFKDQLSKAKIMDEKQARSHYGITFALYCRDVMKAFGFATNKTGFDDMFNTIFSFGREPSVVGLTQEIERGMSLDPGAWFGIGPAPVSSGIGGAANGGGAPAKGSKPNGQTLPAAGATEAKAPPPVSADLGADVEVVITHATTEEKLTVTVRENCTLADVRQALMAALGETKKSEVKLVRKVPGGGFSTLADTGALKGRKALLVLGRNLNVPAGGAAAGAVATNGTARTKASDSEPLKFVVHIDRSLGMRSDLTMPAGTTVLGLKERIVKDDPTGQARADQFSLKVVGSARPLLDSTVLTASMCELEVAASNSL